jgi:hypothetical protein
MTTEEKILEIIDNLKIMSNNYQVLNGQYVISKNVLDVFIENYESEIASLFEGYYEKEFVQFISYNTLSNGKKYFPKVEFFKNMRNEFTLDELYAYWQKEVRK